MKKISETTLLLGIVLIILSAYEIIKRNFQFYQLKFHIIGFFAGLALLIISVIIIKSLKKSGYDYDENNNYDKAAEQFARSTRGLKKFSSKHK